MNSQELTEHDAENGLLTPRQVMARLNVSQKTLWRWGEAGRIRVVKLPGGHRRYPRADVEAIARGESAAAVAGAPPP